MNVGLINVGILFCVLLFCSITDSQTNRICVPVVLLPLFFCVVQKLWSGERAMKWGITVAAVFIILSVVKIITKNQLGMGDVLLLTTTQAVLGTKLNLLLLFFSLVVGFVVACYLVVFQGASKTKKFSFAPCVLVGYMGLLAVAFIT